VSVETALLFATATAAFAIVPGPGILYVVAATLTGGQRAGLAATFGLHLGGYLHVVAAVLGLAALLEAVPMAYAALRVAGAAYLVWMGIGIVRHSFAQSALALPRVPPVGLRQSMVVEALNPKAALFYLAFLPQFTDAGAVLPLPVQLLLLGIAVNIAFTLADVVYVLSADRVARRLAETRALFWLRRTGGAILVGLGINLALSRN
jgi:threonine/homoserine/homoserine lactone efflux protein